MQPETFELCVERPHRGFHGLPALCRTIGTTLACPARTGEHRRHPRSDPVDAGATPAPLPVPFPLREPMFGWPALMHDGPISKTTSIGSNPCNHPMVCVDLRTGQGCGYNCFGYGSSFWVFKVTTGCLRLNIQRPATPEDKDANITAIFELWAKTVSPKARMVIKIDMVNPIPPRKAAPTRSLYLISSGNFAKPNLMAKRENKTMPNGFPKSSPVKIPAVWKATKLPSRFSEMRMPVLANAKSGMIPNATGLCKKCWILEEGAAGFPSLNGIAKARSTPVMAAWTTRLQHQVPHHHSQEQVDRNRVDPAPVQEHQENKNHQ